MRILVLRNGLLGNWLFRWDSPKCRQENYPVAIPPPFLRNPKVTRIRVRSAVGFRSLPIAGRKRHRRTAVKALSAKPLSRPLTTTICSALPRSVMVACRKTMPSTWCMRSLRVREGSGHLTQAGLTGTSPLYWVALRSDCARIIPLKKLATTRTAEAKSGGRRCLIPRA